MNASASIARSPAGRRRRRPCCDRALGGGVGLRVAGDEGRRGATNTVAMRGRLKRSNDARVMGETEIIVRCEVDVTAAFEFDMGRIEHAKGAASSPLVQPI